MSGITQGITQGAAPRIDLLPTVPGFRARTGYAAAGLFRMQETAHGALVDDVAGAQLAAVGGVSLYRRWFRRGVHIPAASYGWAANLYQAGAASLAVVGGFSMLAAAAENIALFGHNASDSCRLYGRVVTSTNKVAIVIADPSAAHNATVTIDHAIVFGDDYALAYHINRTTGFLYGSLRNLTTRTEYLATPLDISAYNAMTSAGTSEFGVGKISVGPNGQGVTHLGLAVVTAGITGTNVASNLTAALLTV